MLLDVSKELEVSASLDACWQVVSDVTRLSGCIPGLSDVEGLEPDRYSATVTDKLGPFRLQLPVRINIVESKAPRHLAAELTGNDGRGQARVQGRLTVDLEPDGAGTRLALNMHMEVLGRLAALGATPMRRRADEVFGIFVERVQQELSKA